MKPFVSICIPAYKRVAYLKRCLESIASQTNRDFEVIVSDDSDDDSVQALCRDFETKFPMSYFRNKPSWGTPANWNYAITKAQGEWIKLLHDDDWFARPDALEVFSKSAAVSKSKFIFSAYANRYEQAGTSRVMKLSAMAARRIRQEPVTLLAENVIGPPSVTLIHRSISELYDERMKWRVDLDFYIRLLKVQKEFRYIDELLINVGVNDTQVTNDCINVPAVELPEGFLLLEKYGKAPLRNIRVFDAWWRLMRNMHIIRREQLVQFGQTRWPSVILSIVRLQSRLPRFILRNGISSKFAMFCSWCINRLTSNI